MSWPPGAHAPHAPPGDDEVHLWQAALDVDAAELDRLDALLSLDERIQAGRFRGEQHRSRYVAAHGQLRALLAGYLGADPRGLRFTAGDAGKPALAGPDAAWLRFNMAHSEGAAVFVVSSGRDVGIDVERIRDGVPVGDIALRFFTADERAALAAASPDERDTTFFDLWVRKEAQLKGRGVGLGTSLTTSLTTAADANSAAEDDAWTVARFDAGAGYAAAVAVHGADVRTPGSAGLLPLVQP